MKAYFGSRFADVRFTLLLFWCVQVRGAVRRLPGNEFRVATCQLESSIASRET